MRIFMGFLKDFDSERDNTWLCRSLSSLVSMFAAAHGHWHEAEIASALRLMIQIVFMRWGASQ